MPDLSTLANLAQAAAVIVAVVFGIAAAPPVAAHVQHSHWKGT